MIFVAQTWLASFHMGALLCKIIFLRFLLSSKDSFFSASVTWTCKREKNDPLKIVACSRKLNLIHMHHIVTSFHYYTKLRCDQIFSINNFSAILYVLTYMARPLVWVYAQYAEARCYPKIGFFVCVLRRFYTGRKNVLFYAKFFEFEEFPIVPFFNSIQLTNVGSFLH